LWLTVEAISSLLIMSTFLANRFQVSIQDLLLPFILITLTTTLITSVFYRLWRDQPLVGLVAALTSALILTSDYDDRLTALDPILRAISPSSRLGGLELPLFSLALIGLVLFGSYWAGRLAGYIIVKLRWNYRNVYGALLIAIIVTFSLSFIPLSYAVTCEWTQFSYKPPQLPAAPVAAKAAAKPDIFYIVLDRYASNDVLKSQFGYDNSDFLKSLRADGFFVNDSAHNNYPYTTMSIASTMSAGYDNDIINNFAESDSQTIIPYNETIRNSPVAQRLQSLGYKYDLIGNWYETSNLSETADQTFQRTGRLTWLNHTYTLNNLPKNLMTQSIWWRFIQAGANVGGFKLWGYENLGDVDMHKYALGQLRDLAAAPAGGRFIFAHILIPHDPYYFQADGSISNNPSDDNVGRPIKQKYLQQLQYINGQMKDILAKINSRSNGQSVVILQSDEGPYPVQLNQEEFDELHVSGELQNSDMTKWSGNDLKMKFGNLAAYYIPKADLTDPITADAADNANVFRLVLNTYFGYELPILPDCYYAYPDGRDKPDVFTNINRQLTGKAPSDQCLANGTVK
jgi:hypothetical protein